jgi:hypothetical protein
MECIHTYHDGSRLFRMSARALCQIPIWKGTRKIELTHVYTIKSTIQSNIQLLDSGYKMIQYFEEEEILKSYVIDGQHRLSIVREYFQLNADHPDFMVTVTEIRVVSEVEAITYFNRINNVKPIQFEEDPTQIVNRYLSKLCEAFPLILSGRRKAPNLSSDKVRDHLMEHVNQMKKITVEQFVEHCKRINGIWIEDLQTRLPEEKKETEINLMKKMMKYDFALAMDRTLSWIKLAISCDSNE